VSERNIKWPWTVLLLSVNLHHTNLHSTSDFMFMANFHVSTIGQNPLRHSFPVARR